WLALSKSLLVRPESRSVKAPRPKGTSWNQLSFLFSWLGSHLSHDVPWRVGFAVGTTGHTKSYIVQRDSLDYGVEQLVADPGEVGRLSPWRRDDHNIHRRLLRRHHPCNLRLRHQNALQPGRPRNWRRHGRGLGLRYRIDERIPPSAR